MKIIVKLFATYRTGRFSVEEREYPPGTTVATIVKELELPEEELGIILVNSRHTDLAHVLSDGDILALFPLLGGG